MIRRSVTCQGGCGKSIAEGNRSARNRGKPWTCLDCRRDRPGYHGKYAPKATLRTITCEICGATAQATTNRDSGDRRQKTCLSEECRKEAERRRYKRHHDSGFKSSRNSHRVWFVNCAECGRLFAARRPKQVICGKSCRRRRDTRITLEGIKRRYREDPAFRDLVISRAHNRHARKLGVGSITSPAALIDYLMKRDGGRCGICHKAIRAKVGPRRPSIDHIVPLSRGGEHVLENLQPAHYDCNLSKGNRSGGQVLLVG